MIVDEVNYSELFEPMSGVELKYAPKNLFFSGKLEYLTTGRRVSVVGSRKVSAKGAQRAAEISEALVRRGIVVVSGLAEGVDTIAHETAIRLGGMTISVLGTPLDEVYPRENAELLEVIKRDHLAISQFPKGYPFQKQNFPIRNRTMALISDATVIVEASEQSGTRHQGWEALRLGRQLFLMRNVAEDPKLSWPKQMLEYGARVLDKANLVEVLLDIPYLSSSKKDLVF